MKFKYALTSLALSVAILSSVPSTAFAIGGASGAKVDYQVQGKIGEVVMNPYDIAPLTAACRIIITIFHTQWITRPTVTTSCV